MKDPVNKAVNITQTGCRTKTPRGEHFVFRAKPGIISPSIGSSTKPIDIRSHGGFALVPGCSNHLNQPYTTLGNVRLWDWKKMPEITREDLDAIFEFNGDDPPQYANSRRNRGDSTDHNPPPVTPAFLSDLRNALEVLLYLVGDQDSWIKYGMCLHSIDPYSVELLRLWIDWSRQSDKFREGECEVEWARFQQGGGLTHKSLFGDAKEKEEGTPSAGLFQPYITDPAHIEEFAIAAAFCQANEHLRYVNEWGRWMIWNGHIWVHEKTLAAYNLIHKFIRDTTATFERKVKQRWNRAAMVAGVERLTKADRLFAATSAQWDRDPWLLNTPGGIIDLRTGKRSKNDPSKYMTKQTIVTPTSNKDCRRWIQFLDEITGHNQELVDYIQVAIGYSLTGLTIEHILFFLHGGGGNGKSVLLNIITYILHDYSKVAPMDLFIQSRYEKHPTDLAMLQGARLVTAQETPRSRQWAEDRIKQLTGGDPITARFMRQDFFTYDPQFTLIISGNNKPSFTPDDAMRRRIRLIPFEVKFAGHKRDPHLTDKLKGEAAGILAWMIKGAQRYSREGFKSTPESVRVATDEYIKQEDDFAQWLEQKCVIGSKYKETTASLFTSWSKFIMNITSGKDREMIGSTGAFADKLKRHTDHDFRSVKVRGQRGWSGLRLRPEKTKIFKHPKRKDSLRIV